MERKLGGCLMDKPKSLLYQDGGSNLCLSLEDIGPGWRSKPQADYQVYIICGYATFIRFLCPILFLNLKI